MGETYKYIWIEDTNEIDHQFMNKMHEESCVKAVKTIFKTKLTPKKQNTFY